MHQGPLSFMRVNATDLQTIDGRNSGLQDGPRMCPKRNTGVLGDDEESSGNAHPRSAVGVKPAHA